MHLSRSRVRATEIRRRRRVACPPRSTKAAREKVPSSSCARVAGRASRHSRTRPPSSDSRKCRKVGSSAATRGRAGGDWTRSKRRRSVDGRAKRPARSARSDLSALLRHLRMVQARPSRVSKPPSPPNRLGQNRDWADDGVHRCRSERVLLRFWELLYSPASYWRRENALVPLLMPYLAVAVRFPSRCSRPPLAPSCP